MTTKAGDVLEGGIEFVLQLATVVALCLAAIWLSPDDVVHRPLSSLSLADVLWLLASATVWFVAITWLYFLAEPFQKLLKK
jgi:hypothetical protein